MDHRANDIMEYPFDTFTVPTHRLFLLPCTFYLCILSKVGWSKDGRDKSMEGATANYVQQ